MIKKERYARLNICWAACFLLYVREPQTDSVGSLIFLDAIYNVISQPKIGMR